MNKKILFSLIFFLSLIFNLEVDAASNPYKSKGPYGVNCTWYTWKKAYEKAGVELPSWGNAKTWYSSAEKAGYSVGKTAKKNSVIVWNMTSYGHVGYVERVSGDNIYVWDSDSSCIDEEDQTYINCMAESVSEETDVACKKNAKPAACKYEANEYEVIGYIYLDDAPKKVNNEPTTKVNTTVKTTTTTIKIKSKNNYLKNITLSVGSIDFDKNVLEYNVEVENDIKSINVNAITEDDKAVLTGVGDYSLKDEITNIKLTVVSESGETKEYVIHVNQKKIETTTNITEEKVDKKDLNSNLIIFIIIGITVLLLVILLVSILKHKKNK